MHQGSAGTKTRTDSKGFFGLKITQARRQLFDEMVVSAERRKRPAERGEAEECIASEEFNSNPAPCIAGGGSTDQEAKNISWSSCASLQSLVDGLQVIFGRTEFNEDGIMFQCTDPVKKSPILIKTG